MNTEITLQGYYDQLARHDWYYMYTDDIRIYRNGSDEETRLRVLAKTAPEYQRLFDDFSAHKFKGGTLPERPA